jgi:hypothetical protein
MAKYVLTYQTSKGVVRKVKAHKSRYKNEYVKDTRALGATIYVVIGEYLHAMGSRKLGKLISVEKV